MPLSKQQLLSRLQELQIKFSQYEHPVVLTVEAQAKYVGHLGSGLSKNLFLKDKKNRFYIVSALADTKVDLKGRNPSYVDLEANPPVGKDQPPDLAALVPSGSTVLPEQPEKQPSSQVPKNTNLVSVDNSSKTASAKAVKPSVSEKNAKGAPVKNGRSSSSSANVGQFVEEILQKTSELLLSQINEGNIKQHGEQLGTVVSDNLRNNLSSDLKNLAMIFKNTAYTEGFHAGSHLQRRGF
ncbi:hypothetical protein PIB30_061896 [Stylosanthes scabra]|uniref:YbaK/aminoacyl-tRNA synthetase-associated domain-containing protein n=1 Tax=Stylosanthes scabra TaxID=79078 RepID=A0ABU6VLZ3_9FABA|nr:hypothetical protein [Stylosanthes scabra]